MSGGGSGLKLDKYLAMYVCNVCQITGDERKTLLCVLENKVDFRPETEKKGASSSEWLP